MASFSKAKRRDMTVMDVRMFEVRVRGRGENFVVLSECDYSPCNWIFCLFFLYFALIFPFLATGAPSS